MEDRNKTHGDPETNLTNIAELWTAYLGVPITPEQVAICNILQKISRTTSGSRALDHYVDMCGYAAIAGQLVSPKVNVMVGGMRDFVDEETAQAIHGERFVPHIPVDREDVKAVEHIVSEDGCPATDPPSKPWQEPVVVKPAGDYIFDKFCEGCLKVTGHIQAPTRPDFAECSVCYRQVEKGSRQGSIA